MNEREAYRGDKEGVRGDERERERERERTGKAGTEIVKI